MIDEQFLRTIPQYGIGGFVGGIFKKVKNAVKKVAEPAGAALGFMIAGPAGASLGAGIGSLIAGKKPENALKSALMAYGIGNLAGSGFFGKTIQGFGGKGIPTFGLTDGNLFSGIGSQGQLLSKDLGSQFFEKINPFGDPSQNVAVNAELEKANSILSNPSDFSMFEVSNAQKIVDNANKKGFGFNLGTAATVGSVALPAVSYMAAKNAQDNFVPGDPNALNALYYQNPEEFQVSGQGVSPYYYTNLQDEFGVPIEDLPTDFYRPLEVAEGGIIQLSNGGPTKVEDFVKEINIFEEDTDESLISLLMRSGMTREEAIAYNKQIKQKAEGGIIQLADGSEKYFPRKNGQIDGPGTGTSDDIPAMLSDGEFVFTAKAVRNAGDGDRREGAKRMYQVMKNLEKGGNLSTETRGVA